MWRDLERLMKVCYSFLFPINTEIKTTYTRLPTSTYFLVNKLYLLIDFLKESFICGYFVHTRKDVRHAGKLKQEALCAQVSC